MKIFNYTKKNYKWLVDRSNVFNYIIAIVNKVKYVGLLKLQELVYNNGEWKINVNNRSDSGANTSVVKDKHTV